MESTAKLATTWLATKIATSRVRDPKNSDDARRDDLCRFARALNGSAGRGRYDLAVDLGSVDIAFINPAAVTKARESMGTQYSSTTVARTMTTVRGFVLWLIETKVVAGDDAWEPVLRADRVEHDPVAHVLTVEELALMLEAAGEPGDRDRSAWPERDVAMLALLGGAGLRASEACALRVADVASDDEGVVLRVDANGKPRRVPLDAAVAGTLERYMRQRRELPEAQEHSVLFVRRDGVPIDRSFITRLISRLSRQVGVVLPDGSAAHALRHHRGVQLAAGGADAETIAAVMGHADGRMAALYIAAAGIETDPF